MAAMMEIIGEASGGDTVSGSSRGLEQVTPMLPVFASLTVLQPGQC